MFICIWGQWILYYTNKQICLNNISYLDGWSMDKGKEHRKLVGKLIDYANRLAPSPGGVCKSIAKTELCGSPFWYYTLHCHKCYFISLKRNVFLVFGLMFHFLCLVGLVTHPSEILIMPEWKRKARNTA